MKIVVQIPESEPLKQKMRDICWQLIHDGHEIHYLQWTGWWLDADKSEEAGPFRVIYLCNPSSVCLFHHVTDYPVTRYMVTLRYMDKLP